MSRRADTVGRRLRKSNRRHELPSETVSPPPQRLKICCRLETMTYVGRVLSASCRRDSIRRGGADASQTTVVWMEITAERHLPLCCVRSVRRWGRSSRLGIGDRPFRSPLLRVFPFGPFPHRPSPGSGETSQRLHIHEDKPRFPVVG